jgi:hypothetical protein
MECIPIPYGRLTSPDVEERDTNNDTASIFPVTLVVTSVIAVNISFTVYLTML